MAAYTRLTRPEQSTPWKRHPAPQVRRAEEPPRGGHQLGAGAGHAGGPGIAEADVAPLHVRPLAVGEAHGEPTAGLGARGKDRVRDHLEARAQGRLRLRPRAGRAGVTVEVRHEGGDVGHRTALRVPRRRGVGVGEQRRQRYPAAVTVRGLDPRVPVRSPRRWPTTCPRSAWLTTSFDASGPEYMFSTAETTTASRRTAGAAAAGAAGTGACASATHAVKTRALSMSAMIHQRRGGVKPRGRYNRGVDVLPSPFASAPSTCACATSSASPAADRPRGPTSSSKPSTKAASGWGRRRPSSATGRTRRPRAGP